MTDGRLSGFGGAPNMGHDPHGRRHSTPPGSTSRYGRAPADARTQTGGADGSRPTGPSGVPTFVETLDAIEVGKQAGMPLPPVMIYGDDVTHVVTEEGVAYLYKAHSLSDRRAALAAVAGVTPVGRTADARRVDELRRDGLVAFPEDLKVETRLANRSLLAARSIEDLVAWSGRTLYEPPSQFRDW